MLWLCLSVHLSQVGVLQKRLTRSPPAFGAPIGGDPACTVSMLTVPRDKPESLRHLREISAGSPPMGAPNAGGLRG